MENISGFGLQVRVIASVTFPQGFLVTQFADDGDPLEVTDLQVGDVAMGLNGDMVAWTKANPVKLSMNVIPKSNDDVNLGLLMDANRVSKGKRSARDKITLIISYPDGTTGTATPGIMTDGPPFKSVASAGRLKSAKYGFAFESPIKVGA